ncbi:MAG: SDR family oxidoreductase [Chloroflexi bacterium]|nr:MAG: SDR family oxidoreductase [Chloroflexota bacterium]
MDREKNALITGASSGIGYELTRLFAHDGYNLVLVARNQKQLMQMADELKEKYSVSVKVISKDLSAASAPEEIFTELQQESRGIDALVNKKLFLPGMLNKRTGKILNLASTAAFQPGPLMAVYYATKAYVLSFSEALANELHGTGVSVTALCPGPTESGFQKKAHMEDSKLFSGKIMDAQTVARIGYRGLMTNKTVVIPGLRNKILVETVRFSPRKMVTRVVRNMQESVHKS